MSCKAILWKQPRQRATFILPKAISWKQPRERAILCKKLEPVTFCQVQASAADICFKMQKLQQKSWWFTVVWCRQAIERKQVSHFEMHLGRLDNKIYLLDSSIEEKKVWCIFILLYLQVSTNIFRSSAPMIFYYCLGWGRLAISYL